MAVDINVNLRNIETIENNAAIAQDNQNPSLVEDFIQTLEGFADSVIGGLTQSGESRKAQLNQRFAQNTAAQNSDNPLGFLTAPGRGDKRAGKLFAAGGAFFNKQMATATGQYRGIEQRIQLPTMKFDASRFYVPRDGNSMLERINNYRTSPLDKPSVYLGGSTTIKPGVEGEMDVGLTLDRVYNQNGEATFTTNPASSDMRNAADRYTIKKEGAFYVARNETGTVTKRASAADVEQQMKANLTPNDNHTNNQITIEIEGLKLHPNFAFRPTERTINIPAGKTKTTNNWYNPPLKSDAASPNGNKYFYPGETVTMSVTTAGKNQANLTIARDGGTAAERFSDDFEQQGLGAGKAWQPKAVVSIDQFTVDSYGLRVGSEFNGTPKMNTRRKDSDGNYVGGVYNQGVQQTNAKLENAVIFSSVLLGENRAGDRPIAGRSFYEVRSNELRERNYAGIFQVSGADAANGGRTINIIPSNISDGG